jgi:hypothetical protein
VLLAETGNDIPRVLVNCLQVSAALLVGFEDGSRDIL